MSQTDEHVAPVTVASPVGTWTITKHKDCRGETGRCECGCAVTRRGGNYRRKFCERHSRSAPPTGEDR